VLGHYQGIVGVARAGWLASHADAAVGYVRGILAALQWLYKPANQAEAVAILAENLSLPLGVAARLFPVVVDRSGGLDPKGAIDVEGVRTVLALRTT
jgi:ABC-type nitrate/sulfonate/bicarbonate transport system substrate-binding protein